MNGMLAAATLIACYLIGSVPFGYLVARARGVDIREQGSRNIGATNVTRVLGRRTGAAVLGLDVLKGFVPTFAAGRVLAAALQPDSATFYGLWLLAAVACVLGHICPLYLRFKGGKGVATGLGAALGIFPILVLPCVVAVALWIAVTYFSGYVSLGSMIAAASFPITTLLTLRPLDWQRHWPIVLYTVLIPGLVLMRHRANIARLRAGTEPKIGRRRES